MLTYRSGCSSWMRRHRDIFTATFDSRRGAVEYLQAVLDVDPLNDPVHADVSLRRIQAGLHELVVGQGENQIRCRLHYDPARGLWKVPASGRAYSSLSNALYWAPYAMLDGEGQR